MIHSRDSGAGRECDKCGSTALQRRRRGTDAVLAVLARLPLGARGALDGQLVELTGFDERRGRFGRDGRRRDGGVGGAVLVLRDHDVLGDLRAGDGLGIQGAPAADGSRPVHVAECEGVGPVIEVCRRDGRSAGGDDGRCVEGRHKTTPCVLDYPVALLRHNPA